MKKSPVKRKILSILIFSFFTVCAHAQSLSLVFNPVVGSTHKLEIIKEVYSGYQVSIDEHDADIANGARAYYLLSFTVLEYTNNRYKIALTIDSSSTSMQVQAGVRTSEEYHPIENTQRSFDYLSGASILLQISNQGKLLNMEGIEDIANSFPVNQAGINVATMYSYMVQELVRLAIPQFAYDPMAADQTWQGVENIDTGLYKCVEETQYTLTDFDHAFAELSSLSSLVPKDGDDAVEMMGMKVKMKLSGTATASMKVDRNTGWVVASEWLKSSTTRATVESPPMQMPPTYGKEKITVKGI